jgi:hypothetical protein
MGRTCSKHEEARKACKISVGKPKGKKPAKRLGVIERIILKWILKYDVGIWTGFSWIAI